MNIESQFQSSYDYLKLNYSKNIHESVSATDGNGKTIALNINRTQSLQFTQETIQNFSSQELNDKLKEYTSNLLIKAHTQSLSNSPLKAYNQSSLEYSFSIELTADIEDGFDFDYFSAENVSKRISDMAIAFSGGNIETLNEMKTAIDKGFKAVEDILGVLPEISTNTYNLVQKKLNEYEASLSTN
ncbi:MAG: hypothetical protein A2Y40_02165 [Candidatus Margulisbacteria bacterium GWF2_35_9]|nr:MAG: hypothetical protein A2Y40_02165 [Candidatus Margulisbacteria bacterium GWF2_35_9]